MATSPGDAAMSALQNVAIPVAAWYGVSKINSMTRGASMAGRAGAFAGGQGMRMATGLAGRGAGMIGLGGVAARGAGVAAGMSSGAAAIGGFAGAALLPIAAGAAVAGGINNVFMDPYLSTRRGMDAMRANTAFQYISGDGSAKSGGFGMSATRAQQISQALTESGQNDLSLSGSTYNEIADNMMRSGIFQEVGDMDTNKIVDGVKKATSVLKMISRITGDPDIQNGVKTLATLKMGGLNDIEEMGRAVDSMRKYSAMSGVSFDQMVNTIGNQGMVMAQQQGIRGATGMLASSAAYAGFTSARRAGIISNAQSKALGGEEGMTQNAMSATYKTMNSPYARMVMQGGSSYDDSMVNVLNKWGSKVSGNPMQAEGDWFANQGFYKEKYMNKYDSNRITVETLRTMAKANNQDPNDGLVLASLAQSMGLSSEEFRSMAELDKARQDPMSRMRMMDSILVGNKSDYASRLQQDHLGLQGVPVLGAAQEIAVKGYANVLGWGAEKMAPVTSTVASISDSFEELLASTKGLSTTASTTNLIEKDGNSYLAKFVSKDTKGPTGIMGTTLEGGLRSSNKHNALISKLNRLIGSGDERLAGPARAALVALTNKDNATFMDNYKKLDKITKGFLSGSTIDFRQELDYEQVQGYLDSGELSAETGVQLNKPKESNMIRDINMAVMSGEESVSKLVDANADNPEFYKTLGISEKDLKGKSVSGKKAFVVDSATKFFNRKMKPLQGSDADKIKAMYARLSEYGLSEQDVKDYTNRSGITDNAMAERLNPAYGDFGDQARKLVKEISDSKSSNTNTVPEASKANWQGLIDLGTNMATLDTSVKGNTTAIEENTKAQLMVVNSRKGWFGKEVSMDDLKSNNPKENTVSTVSGQGASSDKSRKTYDMDQ
jgi:hypothetical protein